LSIYVVSEPFSIMKKIQRNAWWALVPPVALPLLIIAAVVRGSHEVVFDHGGFLLGANTLFLTLIPAAVAIIAARIHHAGRMTGISILGAGLLAFGTGSLLAAAGSLLDFGANFNVTVHNSGVLLLAISCAATIGWQHRGRRERRAHHRSLSRLLLTYSIAVSAMVLLAGATHAGLMPTFFVQGEGPTPLRQVVLLLSAAILISSATHAWIRYRKTGFVFAFWLSLALVLMATSIFGLSFQTTLGSGLNWAGRGAQYLGCIYLLVALVKARREASRHGLSLEETVRSVFGVPDAGYRLLVESSPDIVMLYDSTLHHTYVNPAVERLTGLRQEQFPPLNVHGIGLDDGHARLMEQAIRHVFQSGDERQVEIVYAGAHERTIYHCRFMPLPDPDGGIESVLCIGRDITAHKISEEALIESEATLKSELDTTQRLQRLSVSLIDGEDIMGLCEQILDETKAILSSDCATIQMYHPERGEGGELRLIAHRGFLEEHAQKWQWVGPSTRSSCGMALRSRRRETSSDVRECAFLADSYAQTGIRSLQTTPLISRSGVLLGMLSTHWRTPHRLTQREERSLDVLGRLAADLIERKRAEDALHKLTNELEDRVRQRTSEMEKANRCKDEFLANMSHEIRTPLSGILGMTELSLQLEPSGELQENLEMIRSSALSLNAIVDDLLDFSAIEAGSYRIQQMEFRLGEELRSLTGGYEEKARAKGLSFTWRIEAEVPERVVTDPARVRQILVNLINNAMKFTLAGGVELTVRRLDPDHLAFSVSDTGIGIPEQRIGDIFQSFTQLDATITKRFGGTGLGLAISRRLAELMGGTIDVESREGVGSVFTLIIPFELPGEESAEPELVHAPVAVGPLSILLAEDNPVNRLMIQKHLVQQGHTVSAVSDGKQALEELERSMFDLVLMDIQMPEMNGIEATKAIRSNGGPRPDIPIIALTAYAMKGDRERFLDSGMNGYVTKPVDFGALADTIIRVCKFQN
jgi:PAS domain S-box-containing protein